MDLYRADWIIPALAPPVRDGILAVTDDRISWLGPAVDAPDGTLHDLGHVAILPGFINAHTHLELTNFLGRIPRQPLWTWFDELLRLIRTTDFATSGPDAVRAGAKLSLDAGVTCVADISRTGLNVAVLSASPIRKVCFFELISGALMPPNDAESLSDAINRASAFTKGHELIIGISPHAPYTVTRDDLTAAARLATARNLPLTMHFLESQEESDWLNGRGDLMKNLTVRRLPTALAPPPTDAMDFLESSGVFAANPLLAHVNYVSDAVITRLANEKASVVFCPRAHIFFGHPPHRWQDMLLAGINVCLGTDSLASNESLSILDEIRFLMQRDEKVESQTLLRMATVNAARALKLHDHLGDLSTGLLADLVMIPCETAATDPLRAIMSDTAPVTGVWISGRRLR
ncbi:MAG: amidohydrolase family protein [Planctomycetota bacterium]